jgi:hypothetical protein
LLSLPLSNLQLLHIHGDRKFSKGFFDDYGITPFIALEKSQNLNTYLAMDYA